MGVQSLQAVLAQREMGMQSLQVVLAPPGRALRPPPLLVTPWDIPWGQMSTGPCVRLCSATIGPIQNGHRAVVGAKNPGDDLGGSNAVAAAYQSMKQRSPQTHWAFAEPTARKTEVTTMTIRVIRDNEALETTWEEMVFTESRLLGDANAKVFAANITGLVSRLEQVRSGQLGVWREEITAQAAVNALDDRLDDWVRSFDLVLQTIVKQDTTSPRYKRYFAVPPSQIIRMGPEKELNRVRAWADSLATEPEAALQEQSAQLKSIIVDGDQALERRRNAATARADHRVRDITSLLDDINGARSSLYGALMQQATELHLPRDWPDRFFRHAAKTARAPVPPQPAPQPTATEATPAQPQPTAAAPVPAPR